MSVKKSESYIRWIVWRHLISKKNKTGLSFMTIISIGGVAIGVAALVIVLSVMGGFERDLKSKMFRGLPHLEFMNKNAIAGFSLKEFTLKKFNKIYPDAVGIEPFTQSDVVLKKRKHITSTTLFGIDPKKGGKLWGFSSGIIQGDMKSIGRKHTPIFETSLNSIQYPGIVLGEGVAIQLGADIGEEITILSPQVGVRGAMSGQSLSRKYVVSGIFRTDLPRYDSRYAVVSLHQGRKFMADYDSSLDKGLFVSGVAINFENPEDIEKYEKRSAYFSSLKTLSWKNVNKSLLFALKLEKFTMGSILLLIVLVAAFSISGTIMMNVFHKRGQVALLKSLGMTKGGIAKLFMYQGAAIGSLGIVVGILVGLFVCFVLDTTQFIDLPEGVYYQQKMPVKYLPVEYCVIAVCAWLLSAFAAVYPAAVAAKQEAGIGLRYK